MLGDYDLQFPFVQLGDESPRGGMPKCSLPVLAEILFFMKGKVTANFAGWHPVQHLQYSTIQCYIIFQRRMC